MFAAQAQRIKPLWDALADFDKRATEVHLRLQQPNLRGRFGKLKRSGHTTTEQMKRYVQQCLYMCKKCLCVCLCAIGSFSLGYQPQ